MTYTGGSPNAPNEGIVAASTPVTIALGAAASAIPYPTGQPSSLSWCVVSNSSPFTIVVSQGQVLGQIAAFTSDLYPVRSGQPIAVQAVAGNGLISPGTDSTVYATWYQQLPSGTYPAALGSGSAPFFSTDTIQAQTASTTSATLTFGPFDVSAFAGMRFSIVCEPLFSNCIVDLRWYDTLALATAPGLFDFAGVFDFTCRASDSGSFVIPHQADFLVIKLTSADGGQTKPHWSAANRQQGFDLFGQGLASGTTNQDIPAGNVGVLLAPPQNGPWYRLRNIVARINGAVAANAYVTAIISDTSGVSVLGEICRAFTTAVNNQVLFSYSTDLLIANPTSVCISNGSTGDVRAGASWEVVAPMFKFPRDA